jgi:aminoglycoside phosphotransferase (APT) family kinase protein
MPNDKSERQTALDATQAIAAGLDRIVARRFGAGATLARLERLSGGASQELWSFDAAAGGRTHPLILRRNPGGSVKRETAAGMETEARLIELAIAAGAPAPPVVHVLTPEDGLGAGYVMERIAGETLARRLLRDPEYAEARPKLARQLGEAAARIHAIDLVAAGDLRRTSVEASLASSYAGYQGGGVARPVIEWAFRWLYDHRPTEAGQATVVHGDLRNGNIIVGPEGLRSVLDWEAVHIGDPMEDLGWLCVTSWRFGQIDKPVGGFGPREELFDGYEAASGRRVDAERVRFWEVMGVLRWGMSCAMMGGEFLAGDRSVEKAAIGRRVSETEIDLLAMLAPRRGRNHA